MTHVDVRRAWLQMRDEVTARALANKQTQDAVVFMIARYRQLSADELPVVDDLLCGQLRSEDENERFDALALVEDCRIAAALPTLRELASWLETQDSPGAPYEWAKVNRMIGSLMTPHG